MFAHFTTIAHKLKAADDWRNDEEMAGGDAFFEEGIHWLHLANSLGPRIVEAHAIGYPSGRTQTTVRPGVTQRVEIVMGDSIARGDGASARDL